MTLDRLRLRLVDGLLGCHLRLQELLLVHWVALIWDAHLVSAEAVRRHRRVVAAASPWDTGVPVHEQRVDRLLATVDRTHHESIDLAVDENMRPIKLVLVRTVHRCAPVLMTTVFWLLHVRVTVG